MKKSLVIATSTALVVLAACDKPTVVNTPAPPPVTIVVPGPAGPAGEAGKAGVDGAKGEPGKNADGTTIVVLPPPAPAVPKS